MKKIIALFFTAVLIMTSNAAICKAKEYVFKNADEASRYVLYHMVCSDMHFIGESSKWKASLIVKEFLTETGEIRPGFVFTLTPKTSYSDSILTYTIFTDNGYIQNDVTPKGKNPIEFTTTSLIPRVDEDIVLRIQSSSSSKKDYLILKQVFPENIKIFPEKAADILVNEYYSIFKRFIPSYSTFKIEIECDKYWLITINNFDGEDRMACLLINAETGVSEGMKMEE